MTATKPILVLIHGAWHFPAAYSKFTKALEAAGYEVHVPALTTMNQARPPTSDLGTDAAHIRSYIEGLVNGGSVVAVIMHSYGGQVGSDALPGLGVASRAARGLPGGVSHLVYLCAYVQTEGNCPMGLVAKYSDVDRIRRVLGIGEDYTCTHPDPRGLLIGADDADADVDEEESEAAAAAAEYVAGLGMWNSRGIFQATAARGWQGLPKLYIGTRRDVTVPPAFQEDMVGALRDLGEPLETLELDTGHAPHLTMTEEVVEAVNRFLDA
ncbi:Alpha/beta hydrolase fold-1 [Xylariomycetidae sp. FL0641]|nr:Alpha/beta hydrolase fold-1 [Xylariomycetidae sp. FL0641]